VVLAPVQAGHAVGAIARLREHRIDPLTIAATLRLATAQRLARRLCRQCREPVQADGSVSALLGFDPGTFLYAPRGCPSCEGGYRGRIAVFEALPIDGAIRRLVRMGGDEAVIASHAYRDRPNLSGAARFMVRQGLIGAEDAVFLARTPVRALV
jgi:general secretion pathway protein E